MPYCRNCGAKLDEDARFCRVCGSPVTIASVPSETRPSRRARRPFLFPVAILIAILALAFVFAVVAFVPFRSVSYSRSLYAGIVPGVETIRLSFESDVADVNIISTNLQGYFVKLDVSASGSTGLFGSTSLQTSLTNQTLGNTLTVNGKVSREEAWPLSFNVKVKCNLYVDRSEVLDIIATTNVGDVGLNVGEPVTFDSLSLHSTTGSVRTSLTDGVLLNGNLSATTTTGSVQFSWSNARVSGNTTFALGTTTGSVTTNVTQNRALGGDVFLNAKTTTGSVNFGLEISGNVGSQIKSQTTTGSITTDVENFNGNKSPIYSANYPAESNFLANLATTTGSVHIRAIYHGTVGTSA